MCQEVGHTLGLDRTSTRPTRDPDGPPSNEHPNSHDYNQLVTIYSHTDSFSTTRVPDSADTLAAEDSPAAG
jgi:hypothetical protein